MSFNSLLKNKNVLYVVSFLALTNVFSYLISNNVDALIYFILIGYITTYFSKNMIVILLVPMLFTNFFMGIRFANNVTREGMANQNANDSLTTNDNKNKEEKKDNITTSVSPSVNKEVPTSTSNDTPSNLSSSIDYSKTLEKAYDDLDKLIGTDGINKMTDETKRLAEQQQKIMKNIENMAPLLQNATKMLEGLPLDNIGKIQESLSGFMNRMGKK
jgi:hypothetical protein